MKTARSALPLLVSALLATVHPSAGSPAGPASNVGMRGHCAPATVTPIAGEAGAYRVQTPHGPIFARRQPAAPSAATAQLAVIHVFPIAFDADGDTLGTVHDTIVVAPGTTVRWVRAGPGFHTVTNGADSGDPDAAA